MSKKVTTNLKHPHIEGLTYEVEKDAVAEWVAAGWINPAEKKPKEAPKANHSPATAENTENKDEK